MIQVQKLEAREIVRKALTANSFVADSKGGLRVMYERHGDGYLFILKQGSGKVTEEPTFVTREAFKNGLKTCLRDHWAMQIYSTRKVITWK